MCRKSSRLLLVFLLGAALLLTAGCANMLQQRQAIVNCSYALKSVALQNIDLSGGVFRVLLGVTNPNKITAVLDALDFKFYLNDTQVSQGRTTQRLDVPAGQARELPIDVAVRFSDIGNLVNVIRNGKPKSYKVAGTATINTALGNFDLPVSVGGTF